MSGARPHRRSTSCCRGSALASPTRRGAPTSGPTSSMAGVQALDLGGLLSMAGGLADALRGVVAANQAGTVDPAGHARAQELGRQMATPVEVPLPGTGHRRGGGARGARRRCRPPVCAAPGVPRDCRRRLRAGGRDRAARRRARGLSRAARRRGAATGPLVARRPAAGRGPGPGLGLRRGVDRPGRRLGPGGPHGARERGAVPALVRRGVPLGRGVARGLAGRRDHGGAARADDGRAHVARVAGAPGATRRAPRSAGCRSRSDGRWASRTSAGRRSSGAAWAGRTRRARDGR